MDRQQREDMDRHITGNWGEDSVEDACGHCWHRVWKYAEGRTIQRCCRCDIEMDVPRDHLSDADLDRLTNDDTTRVRDYIQHGAIGQD